MVASTTTPLYATWQVQFPPSFWDTLERLVLLGNGPFRFQLICTNCVSGLTWHFASVLKPSTTMAGENDAVKKEKILSKKLPEHSQWLKEEVTVLGYYLLQLWEWWPSPYESFPQLHTCTFLHLRMSFQRCEGCNQPFRNSGRGS